MKALLEVSNLSAAYGESRVLSGIDFCIAEGEVCTLLGRNGMGKTSTVRAICGLMSNISGQIRFGGTAILGERSPSIARRGISVVPEGRQVFPNLTVKEHLTAFVANRFSARDPWTQSKVFDLFPQLAKRSGHMGTQLSGGEQQMLAIGRALTTNPRLLILDEATEGLAPVICEEVWECLARLRNAGQTTLVIDKHVHRLIQLADHHTIIEKGRVVWQGTSLQLDADHNIWHRHLGV